MTIPTTLISVENALHAWVVAGSALSATNVIWAQQNSVRPQAPYIALRLGSIRHIGHDWIDVLDAVAPSPGLEIEHRSRGVRDCSISLQCFSTLGTGATMATMILERVLSAANLPTPRALLVAAGIGLGEFEPIRSIDGVINSTVFEPRAILEGRFFLASEVSEFGTYIETVDIERNP